MHLKIVKMILKHITETVDESFLSSSFYRTVMAFRVLRI